ncbi:NAD-dependent dihydropyrimidine dehydrogenase subunit PreA [Anoxynatronum sibiricum]|uniref:dihydrouracil dehydrogenase (NAD(+)) n=1 Tax=Anoxynatronum sibiricum TaxID=210623 RepID=A0ABU9VXG8_9CLOT
MAKRKDLSMEFCGVKCENPFFLSSSPVGSNYDMCKKALEGGWGGIVYKTIGYWIPQECSPRFDQTRKEGTSFVGFKNMEMISDKPTEKNLEMMYQLKKDFPDKVLVASIMGENTEEWKKLAKAVTEIGADIIECNFSCPQMTTHAMGSDVGCNFNLVAEYTRAVVESTHLPVMPKMTPNLTLMELPARAAVKNGAKAIAAINTIKSITEVDLDNFTCLPIINGKSSISGYSGKAVKPIALRFIAQMAQDDELKNIPISGMGGIETWQDALEFLLLGAGNLQVTTSVMQYGYRIVEDLISGVSYWMEEKGITDLSTIVGQALPNIVPAEEIERDFKVYPKYDHDKCVGCGRCYVSCYDGGHQAIDWNETERRPYLNEDKCVGCGLCWIVCPVENCITPGEVKFHDFGTPRDIHVIPKQFV